MGLREFFSKTVVGYISRTPTIAPKVNTNLYNIAQDDNTNAFIAGHENYLDYVNLPNIANSVDTDQAFHSKHPSFTPFVRRRNDEYIVTDSGKQYFDSANPDNLSEGVFRSDLQLTFDQKREIPVPPALVPAAGVFVPKQTYNYGWSQVHVPDNGDQYTVSALHAPSIMLSHPIKVIDRTGAPAGMDSGARKSIKASAPRQRRG